MIQFLLLQIEIILKTKSLNRLKSNQGRNVKRSVKLNVFQVLFLTTNPVLILDRILISIIKNNYLIIYLI